MKRRVLVLTLGVLILSGIIVVWWLSPTIRWGGSFPQVEIELTFLDEDGNPIPGIELEVQNHEGKIAYCYPVTDYQEGFKPVSDRNGVMVFHHIGLGVEFGGATTYLFDKYKLWGDAPPDFSCHFRLAGNEVQRLDYGESFAGSRLSLDEWHRLPIVRREWKRKLSCGAEVPERWVPEYHELPETLAFQVLKKTLVIKAE